MQRATGGTFPYGTLAVNVIGSFLVGFLATLLLERAASSPLWRSALLIGFCGGFTTFSSFSLESLNLARGGQWPQAAGYVFGSLVFCLLGVWLGHMAAVAANGR